MLMPVDTFIVCVITLCTWVNYIGGNLLDVYIVYRRNIVVTVITNSILLAHLLDMYDARQGIVGFRCDYMLMVLPGTYLSDDQQCVDYFSRHNKLHIY